MRMAYLDNIVNQFIEKVKKNDFFNNKKVIRSYPSSTKYTLLKEPVIAVSFKDVNLNENAVGENVKSGSYSISANIYIPFLCGNSGNVTAEKIVSEICKSVDDFDILGIKISKTISDSITECYITETVFTFNGELEFGEVIA